MGGLGQRPLSEVSPMAQRRNSPIWNQTTKMPVGEATAYDISPLNNTSAQRLFWKGRESPTSFAKGAENRMPYDPESSYFPARRPSLEDLKRASRVKNNASMFRDTEYDPAHVNVPQRPLAADRSPNRDSQMNLAKSKFVDEEDASSLSKGSRYGKGFDPSHDIWSEYDNAAYGKSVKFDAAPPQVNEYEMRTPDLSSLASGSRETSYDSEEDADVSFEHESSVERDDSFDASLEDIEKTPVVLPEDWRFMSPESGNEEEDSFVEHTDNDTSDERPVSRGGDSSSHSRVESLDSNGERRPLPPLPSVARMSLSGSRPTSPGKLAAAIELGSSSQRDLPAAPRPASCSKSDINGGMSLEERLRLMMLHEQQGVRNNDEKETNESSKTSATSELEESAHENDTPSAEPSKNDVFSPPRISRDSILRDIRKSEIFEDEVSDDDSQISSSPNPYDHYDPDVPIPSLEDDDDDSSSVIIKEEAHDDDLYAIPDYYQNHSDNSLSSRDQRAKYDEDSNYSLRDAAETTEKDNSGQTTPIAEQHNEGVSERQIEESKETTQSDEGYKFDMASIRQSLARPVTPEIKQEHEDELSEPSTPESVIRHPIGDGDCEDDEDEAAFESSSDESVPEPVATIKAPGAGLKTRPSLTPADLESMAATRRKISGQHVPPVPSLPPQISTDTEREDQITDLPPQLTLPTNPSQRQSSLMQLDIPFSIQEESLGSGLNKEFDRVIESQKVAFQLALSQFDCLPVPASQADRPLASRTQGLPSFADFVRPANQLYNQQRGYLMRQNTKVVIANNRNDNDEEPTTASEQSMQDLRGTRSAGSSPRKPSQQTWTTEPWNGSTRRPSIKMAGAVPRKKPVPGVGSVPPLPGQPSNVQEAQATIEENEALAQDSFEEGEERGRLFVKVVGIKYLDLPLPRGERSHFALTLDNGLHCVTTSWLELGKSAPIGQEFELIVQNDLEFQLTLQMKVDESKLYPQENTASPARQKTSALSRVFASPRRRKELDLKQQMQTQQSKDVNAPVYDRLRNLVARDGSFARAYVALSDHEKQAFGRPYIVDVACFNEWAVDEQPSSVKSKKSATSMTAQRRPPYKIGKLELQLLFVPKPKGCKEDDMPKSMNACIREMRDAESVAARSWEGFLSQQGGDCPFWRRRFFKLQGSKLTAYHETTRQPRATINLAKASKLIDDRPSLTQKETSTKNGGRRKSAFAEEEDGYMFVEEGFRIRFGNGEVIDFYADSATDKDGWLRVMSEAVGKGSSSGNGALRPWADLVLKRERSMKARRSTTDRLPVGPPSPTGKRQSNMTGAPPASAGSATQVPSSPRPRHKHTQSQPEVGGIDARRQKTRSLMF
ncbi:short-chain dehydrogenase [Penicillium atrosanguineum]|uniref:short-chain dehydrogenase n=1 Tax=Penicillium atrosanguineum TaxID=1132637 RepID=UPI0023A31EC3|nr:short-chain dehydrogenase [Penicillium atrosanguineum]KAJ5310406.1 short-chain dehydrogenase [Penicillium atrosanguineum]